MLHLYHSNRLERLADELANILTVPLGDPFAAETLVVQHQGMGRWLSLELARRLGICANTTFLLPAGFIWQLLRQLRDDVPENDRYQPVLTQWWLFDRLSKPLPDKLFFPLTTYLQTADELMRFQLAGEIANCFDQYLVYRPDWIKAWEAGQRAVKGDDWQAHLWRELRAGRQGLHWVDLQQRLSDSYRAGELDGDRLPERVCLFALSTLSPGYLEILNLAAQFMDIHLFMLNPAEGHWMDLVSEKEMSQRALGSEVDALYLDVGNPLLASLGGQGRDFLSSLIAFDPGSWEAFVEPESNTLLHDLQRDILLPQGLEDVALNSLNLTDRSLEFHVCHSPIRELEVLHDQLLDRFSQDPTLQPSDVLVMTPDMDTFAPYIEAVFGESDGTTTIPYTLSDRSQIGESPVASLFLQLLTLMGGRYHVDQMLSLLEQPILHRRFGLQASDLPRIRHWLELVAVRWGKDGADREKFGLPVTGQNSWQAGLDRLLLGYAFPGSGDELFEGVLPCSEVEGSEAQLVGYLHSFLSTLFDLETQILSAAPVSVWKVRINDLIDRFFDPDEESIPQIQALRSAIARTEECAAQAGFSGSVSRELISTQLRQQLSIPTSSRFLGGGVSFCALTPLRALPFKLVCMIGMNDAVFPRDKQPVGFDLMAGSHRLGDRSRRADDRYLFLETLISARVQLYISYTGRDIRDNSILPPSVLVSELRDYLDVRYQPIEDRPASDYLTLQHPLQAFSSGYFKPSSRLFSYSQPNCEGAIALQKATPANPSPFIARPLVEAEASWRQVELNQLVSFFINPVRYLLSRRLGINLAAEDALPDHRDPFEMDYFSKDRLFKRLVDGSLQGAEPIQLMTVERARGLLPHGVTGEIAFDGLADSAQQFAAVLTSLDNGTPVEPLLVNHTYDELHLQGQLDQVGSSGVLGFTYNKLPDARLLGLWIRHLALNVSATPQIKPVTRWLSQEGLLTFQPVSDASIRLNELLDLYWQGLHEPIPLFAKSARAYATSLQQEKPRERCLKLARERWFGGFAGFAEYDNPYYQLAFPDGEVLDERFEILSAKVFGPLLSALEVS
ncbi:MAG: exodeoxyribonuclease V subunit gamma [Sedimenticola thiotaurini]|uniref:RecBCD enzyme subunit RecC n=1 Tax=Sedimenticola thiotaurini TaxID=1543721 RepID=A0A558CUD8_9GAMM|nr:MAG: exodeoxyribonuclease V subunit gamma [Sedimenticola thiotaurini]